ncbi:MAG: PadR family transcriptional regulator [Methanobacteriaceae archaeon]|nr:PadR family transcriptional regulator [Methanobacteriaceae archaeon]
MSRISDIEAAILGLLYEHHHYAYRLEQIIKKRGMRNWADIGFSSIYYVLKRLEEKELVESKMRTAEGKPSRKVYTITEEGQQAMQEKVQEILSENKKQIYSFDLGMANIEILGPKKAIYCLNNYLKSTEERIEFLEESIAMHESINSPYNVIALFTRPRILLKAEKSWVENFIQKIKESDGI